MECRSARDHGRQDSLNHHAGRAHLGCWTLVRPCRCGASCLSFLLKCSRATACWCVCVWSCLARRPRHPQCLTTLHTSQPTDSGDGLCTLGRKPSCCSGPSSSSICAKCRQGRHLPCPLITRYRLELDDSPSFQDLDFVREYDVPGTSRRLSQTQAPRGMPEGPSAKVRLPGDAWLIEGGPEDEADPLGGGLRDMRNRTLYSLDAPNLPLGR